MAPSIQYPQSENILLTAADHLSTRTKHFSSIWAPLLLQTDQSSNFDDLDNQRQNLEKLLDALKEDIKNKKLVKRRKVEILTIEDSPMRQLANEILNNLKVFSSIFLRVIE